MIALILTKKIISMAVMMLLGFLMVRLKLLKGSDSKVLSTVSLYIIMPCVLISSFQVEFTKEVREGILLALGAAVLVHAVLILVNEPMKRWLKLDAVEQASVIYSNSGNLIIPLVTAILGKEWVIYSSAFLSVQMVMLWSHGKSLICGEKGLDLKKILCNVNMISILVGILLMLLGLKLPDLVSDTMDSFAGMVGPMAMLVTGMLMGEMNLKKIFLSCRLWGISALRLVAVPLLILLILKYCGLAGLVPNGSSILLVTILAVITPSASTITQLSQVYGLDAEWAGAINVLTTILCVATMPLMIAIYQM